MCTMCASIFIYCRWTRQMTDANDIKSSRTEMGIKRLQIKIDKVQKTVQIFTCARNAMTIRSRFFLHLPQRSLRSTPDSCRNPPLPSPSIRLASQSAPFSKRALLLAWLNARGTSPFSHLPSSCSASARLCTLWIVPFDFSFSPDALCGSHWHLFMYSDYCHLVERLRVVRTSRDRHANPAMQRISSKWKYYIITWCIFDDAGVRERV